MLHYNTESISSSIICVGHILGKLYLFCLHDAPSNMYSVEKQLERNVRQTERIETPIIGSASYIKIAILKYKSVVIVQHKSL